MKKYTYGIILSSLIAIPVFAQGGTSKMFENLDTNKDGAVSHAEMMAKTKSDFAEFDKNNDGVILFDELPKEMPLREGQERFMKKIKERHEKKAENGKRRGMGRMSPEEMENKMRPTRIKFMARLDTNGDERLDVDEFSKRSIRRFKKADANGDGTVTREEMEKVFQKKGRGKFRKRSEKRHN
jgi:Ca2+-binding EF-hand superfamily protein